jgi:rubredoxin
MHRHRCKSCGFIWSHSNWCFGIDEAHKCPICGKYQWKQYRGKKEARLDVPSCKYPRLYMEEFENVRIDSEKLVAEIS